MALVESVPSKLYDVDLNELEKTADKIAVALQRYHEAQVVPFDVRL